MKLELRRVTLATPRAEDARRRWPERHSLLLRLADAAGRSGVGEASPLPGYSPDLLSDVETALTGVSARAVEEALEQKPPRAALRAVAKLVPVGLPSARMALETAALDLLGQRHALSAPALLGAVPNAQRPLAELVGPASSATLLEDCERALRAGYGHLKLKLGTPGKLAEELSAVVELRERCGPHVSLRLDANQSLDSNQVATAWGALAQANIELFEEPGQIPPHLSGAFLLALDESLQGLDETAVESLLLARKARCVVLKPMALGGLDHCLRLAERARLLGASAVISHCFDGPFAWRAAAALALALPPGPAQGLAPHAGLPPWQPAALPVRQGMLEAWDGAGLGSPAEHAFA